MTPEEIRQGLERDIIGYEIDEQLARTAREKLDSIAAEHNIGQVNWNLHTEDFLCSSQEET